MNNYVYCLRLAIRFMDRHEDWAVIICLVGLGQDIHNGETGVFGWFHALLDRYPQWEAFHSPNLFRDNVTDEAERGAIAHFPGSKERAGLHLGVSVRSFRAEKVSAFVNADLPNIYTYRPMPSAPPLTAPRFTLAQDAHGAHTQATPRAAGRPRQTPAPTTKRSPRRPMDDQAFWALANPARRDIIRMDDRVQNRMDRIGRRHKCRRQ